ncbi:alpha/beta fold hydrolase [Neptuniibacter marinus]|uniref:alpha/beta fold hydrolase n=1 Tax=Neptuniibacter marinus TaxID=1806670 RepID=UPI000831ADEA|nr:alpha/beta hydrolase [Neptuniibacter marinus]
MEYLTRPDLTKIHFVSLGEGNKTLIFLHGWTACVREWLPFASELAQQHRVVCWDARGHGGHPYSEGTNMTLPEMADDLHTLLNYLDIQEAVIIGHSLGALTTWEYIRKYGQDRIAGLCMVDHSPKLLTDDEWNHGVYGEFSSKNNETFIQLLKQDFTQSVLELIAYGMHYQSLQNFQQNSHSFQKMRDYLQKQNAPLLIACWENITQQDYRDVLPTINTPTLLIYGEESQFYCAKLQNWVHQHIENSELLVYPSADHSPHLWHRHKFIYDLNRFVDAL